jgi:hypothetical protein
LVSKQTFLDSRFNEPWRFEADEGVWDASQYEQGTSYAACGRETWLERQSMVYRLG